MYKYKFTIVMPVYNVEEFIDEAVQSVIDQEIGIENIQLLLIDDGASDNSGEICDKYAELYPNNIFAVHKPNGGLSSARNAGLDLTEGKYVTFTDPDDILPPNALSEVWEFFEAHYEETDITAIKLMYFDGKRGNHYLNYKFSKENRVENLKENWDCPHMSVASAFIKTSAIGDLRFDDRLSFAEDGLFSQTIIMEKQTIGLVSSTQYNYRIRLIGSDSLIQGSANNPKWYLPTLKYYHMHLINKAKERFGYIPKYLQMVLMYELQWRFKRAQLSTGVLTEEEEQEYYHLICDIAKNIDDDVIDAQRYIWRDIKLFVMSLKYDRRAPDVVEFEDDLLLQYSPETSYKISNNTVNFDFVELENGKVTIEGFTLLPLLGDKDIQVQILVNGKEVPHKHFQRNIFDVSLTNQLQENYSFSASFDINKKQKQYKIQVAIVVDGQAVVMKKHVYRNHVRFNHKNTSSYMYKDGWKFKGDNKNAIVVKRCGFVKHVCAEFTFAKSMFKSKRFKKVPLFRAYYAFRKMFKVKPIWIITDRPTQGGDNGEALYKYMLENHKEINTYFILAKDAPDFERLAETGNVLAKGSYKHKINILLSDCIISSHAENDIFNPFGKTANGYRDILCGKKRVFLQHGITKDDVSDWLNRYSKNFSGFICAAKPEYDSMLDEKYFYNENKIWLTGFPRFDALEDNADKRIAIMPTWRKYLCGKWDPKTDVWKLLPGFCESTYYKFYNGLINDKKLIDAAKKHGYEIDFFPHPNLQPHIDLFEKNDTVNFIRKGASYTQVYNHSALAITDYSSAIFDFAYLRKPLIYTHFDSEEFFAGEHVYTKGYFDYERDGFGEVEYDLESTVGRIIEYMENGCQLKPKYRERIDNFFAFNDKNNCQRVCEKIIALSKK